MHLIDYSVGSILAFAGLTGGLGAAMLALSPVKGRPVRVLFWATALSFGSSGIVWSATSEGDSLPVQMTVAAVIAAIAAAGLTWGLWELRTHEQPASTDKPLSEAPETKQPSTGILIRPGANGNRFRIKEGIFGFDRAVDAQGENNQVDAGILSSGPPPAKFNPDAGAKTPPTLDQALTKLSNEELRDRVYRLCSKLRLLDFENSSQLKTNLKSPNPPQALEASRRKREVAFNDGLKSQGLALRNELLRRLNQPLTYDLETTTLDLQDGNLAGPSPLSDVSHVLEQLSDRLQRR